MLAAMTELQRYLAEEIAIDHRDGHITRREALRRLALLGVGALAGTAMLSAACTPQPSESPGPVHSGVASSGGASGAAAGDGGGAAPSGVVTSPAVATTGITFAGPEGRKLMGAWAAPTSGAPRGAVLVVHENKGLTPHIENVAGRFAHARYAALAIDLLSEEGGTPSLGDPANATAALGKVAPERFVADMKAGLDELARRAPGVKLAAIGFCFGGGMTWRLVASKDPRLAAAAPFYGPLPDAVDFGGSKAAVLGVYAEKDSRVNASRETAKAALDKAGLANEIVTYPGVDHAFHNDTGPRYDATASAQAWTKVLDWFAKHVG